MVYLKLDGETILSHHHIQDATYTFEYNGNPRNLIAKDEVGWHYIYKVVAGELVELTQEEIDNHPNAVEKVFRNKKRRGLNLMSDRLAIQAFIAHAQVPQDIKDSLEDDLTAVNQALAALLGL